MLTAAQALARLYEGNRRFVVNQSALVFDQGFGDLFVIRRSRLLRERGRLPVKR
jgi:hypothetical protein